MDGNRCRSLLRALVVALTLLGLPAVSLGQTGYLHVTSEPEAAEIYIAPGSEKRGITPFRVELPAGSYAIRVVKEFYQERAVTVQVRVDRVEKLHIKLERRSGWEESKPKEEAVARGRGTLTIITDPDGASIWIDGQPTQGKTPLTVDKLQAGRRRVKLEYEGVTIEREIVLRSNQVVKIVEDLQAAIAEKQGAEERARSRARAEEEERLQRRLREEQEARERARAAQEERERVRAGTCRSADALRADALRMREEHGRWRQMMNDETKKATKDFIKECEAKMGTPWAKCHSFMVADFERKKWKERGEQTGFFTHVRRMEETEKAADDARQACESATGISK